MPQHHASITRWQDRVGCTSSGHAAHWEEARPKACVRVGCAGGGQLSGRLPGGEPGSVSPRAGQGPGAAQRHALLVLQAAEGPAAGHLVLPAAARRPRPAGARAAPLPAGPSPCPLVRSLALGRRLLCRAWIRAPLTPLACGRRRSSGRWSASGGTSSAAGEPLSALSSHRPAAPRSPHRRESLLKQRACARACARAFVCAAPRSTRCLAWCTCTSPW